jgi:hypothetical protein
MAALHGTALAIFQPGVSHFPFTRVPQPDGQLSISTTTATTSATLQCTWGDAATARCLAEFRQTHFSTHDPKDLPYLMHFQGKNKNLNELAQRITQSFQSDGYKVQSTTGPSGSNHQKR